MSDSITREEQYLNAMANGESIDLKPITREEQFLAKAAGQNVKVPTPITRKEVFLSKISGAGGGKLEQEKAVEITENGATEIFPDEGYTLSKVTANVNVSASGENKFTQLVDGSITEVTAGDLAGVTTLKGYAFYNALKLSKIVLPEGLTNIEYNAFVHSTNLYIDREIHIPLSLIQIGTAFKTLPKTVVVHYAGDLSNWLSINFPPNNGPLSSRDGSHLYINNNELLQGDITIPDGITIIPSEAFHKLLDIADVNTNQAQIIGRSAFAHSSVENVVLGSAVTTFDDPFQFSDCTKLRTVRFNSTPTGLESRTFIRSTNLTDIYVPWAEGAVSEAPWGATNATIHYNTPISEGV